MRMNTSNWNTLIGQPKRRMPAWGKFLLGCGVIALLALTAIIGFSYWAAGPGKERVMAYISERTEQALEKPWAKMSAVISAIQTDAGALQLYSDNPDLKRDFPAKEDFLKNSAQWRSKVADFPQSPPSMEELSDGSFQFNNDWKLGEKRVKIVEMGYRIKDKASIRMRWEDEKLVEIEIK
jgi:hypothetical protein